MGDTKMLQAIIDGQAAVREDLSGQIQEVKREVKKVSEKIDKVENKVFPQSTS
ncbi:hypothetical protein HYT59_01970 [Candidatus Woesebacteria bacterium]|nr:hypothetical protein [Candidatus Woesebacteria bacterium]